MFLSKVINNLQYMDADDKGGTSGGDTTHTDTNSATVDWSKVDWSKVDVSAIPETVVKQLPAYKSVLDESVQRRQTIKQLKGELSKLNLDENSDEVEKKAEQTTTTTTNPNPNADMESIKTMLNTLTQAMNKQQTDNLTAWRDEAAKATGIKSPTVMLQIAGTTRDEVIASAKKIASELGIVPPATSAGYVGSVTGQRDKSALEEAKNRIMGKGSSNPFNEQLHKANGGGAYGLEGYE